MKNIAYIIIDNRKYINARDKISRMKNNFFNYISVERLQNGIIILLPQKYGDGFKNGNNKNIKKQIKSIIQKERIKKIICEDNVKHFLGEEEEKKIFNEKNLMKYLIIQILEYIYKYKNCNMALDDVYVLVNGYTKENINVINKFASKFKSLNIVTENISKFKRLESFYEENGILVTISSNKRKSLRNAKLIINMEFDNSIFNKYNANNNSIIINLANEKFEFKKNYNGIFINNFEIKVKSDKQCYIKEFYGTISEKLLYESIIFNKDFNSIDNYVEKEQITVEKLVGIRGVISPKEFTNLLTKNEKSFNI